MKRPTKQLVDDLLADSASPEFCAELMAKTMSSARQRKRLRRLRLTLGGVALAGWLAFAFQAAHKPATSPVLSHPPMASAATSPTLDSVPGFRTRLDAGVTVIQTREASRPREISDQELLASLAGQSVALTRCDGHAALISFGRND